MFCISASCGRPETALMVSTLHFDAFSRACNYPTALAAENVFFYVRFFFFCFILNNVTGLFITIFLRRVSKKITGVGITCNHFLIKIVRCLLLVVRDLCKTKGSRKNNFTFSGVDPSRLTALQKLGICRIFLRFCALSVGHLNA